MKFLFDLFPIILFFAAFKAAGIYVATGVAIAATFAQIGWLKFRRRKVDTMMWVSLVIIVVFGGATIWFHDETFIKWKPTILYWLFAAALLAGQLFWRRNLLQSLLGAQIDVAPLVWNRLLWAWIAFFLAIGVVNLVVAYSVPTETWVSFKLFGLFTLTMLYTLGVGVYLARHMKEVDG